MYGSDGMTENWGYYVGTFQDMIVVLMESVREQESLLCLSFVLVDFGGSSPGYLFSIFMFLNVVEKDGHLW
ncbi:hypothetical protein L873DRAFT_1803301 [Choiromyces venosus 120613-1]|uniref:Uncharacterized protein n=1 Tax=Choiromyces venosus 120613-1 TaxID=1336337 RepID=A0A3N4JT97_9PEZI|nr:hypothetical protein L873DRAFT_1803301 [Choiromyces venosus 120613-1]